MAATYVCAQCEEEFEEVWTDEEAEAEALENFGVENAMQNEGMEVVCDPCYQIYMKTIQN